MPGLPHRPGHRLAGLLALTPTVPLRRVAQRCNAWGSVLEAVRLIESRSDLHPLTDKMLDATFGVVRERQDQIARLSKESDIAAYEQLPPLAPVTFEAIMSNVRDGPLAEVRSRFGVWMTHLGHEPNEQEIADYVASSARGVAMFHNSRLTEQQYQEYEQTLDRRLQLAFAPRELIEPDLLS